MYKGHFGSFFEMLDMSIFDFMRSKDFTPLHLSKIRVIALKSADLVHIDIKSDSVMLVSLKSQPLKVKLIIFRLV